MTKEELYDKILESFHEKYLSSDLSDFLLNFDVMGFANNMSTGEMEEHVYSLLDDLAEDVLDTLNTTGVMRVKEQNPV